MYYVQSSDCTGSLGSDFRGIDVATATASRPVDEEKVKGMISRTSSFDEVNSVP